MVAAIAGVASVAGSLITADSAGSAAQGQSDATAQSNALQQYMYDNNVKLQMPTINTGNGARDRLSYLLGLSPNGFSGNVNGAPKQTYDTLRASLLGQYTKNPSAAPSAAATGSATGRVNDSPWLSPNMSNPGMDGYGVTDGPANGSAGSYIDETGLDAAIKQRLAEQDAAEQAMLDAAKNDPNYGRLSQQYVPDKFSFTSQDFLDNKDPGYEWRLQQGQKALDRQGAAAGRFLSGAQLQASSDYNQGAASQEFQSAYGRALGTFGTNEGNRFNAFQTNFNNAVNPLLSLAGAATLGSQNLGAAGSAYASQVGSNLQNNANAQGAAGISAANGISGSLTGAVNGYQQNQLLSSLMSGRGVNNNPYAGGTLPNASAYDFTRD